MTVSVKFLESHKEIMWQSIPPFAYTLIKTCSFINNLVKRAEAVYVVNIYKMRKSTNSVLNVFCITDVNEILYFLDCI